jgi:hypothetical protein
MVTDPSQAVIVDGGVTLTNSDTGVMTRSVSAAAIERLERCEFDMLFPS